MKWNWDGTTPRPCRGYTGQARSDTGRIVGNLASVAACSCWYVFNSQYVHFFKLFQWPYQSRMSPPPRACALQDSNPSHWRHALHKVHNIRIAPHRDDRARYDDHEFDEYRQSDSRPALGLEKRVTQEVCTMDSSTSKGHHVSRVGA